VSAEILLPLIVSVLVAVAVPLAVEYARRPVLVIEPGDSVNDERFSIVHLRVRNVPQRDRHGLS
jgi:hypothetical protein